MLSCAVNWQWLSGLVDGLSGNCFLPHILLVTVHCHLIRLKLNKWVQSSSPRLWTQICMLDCSNWLLCTARGCELCAWFGACTACAEFLRVSQGVPKLWPNPASPGSPSSPASPEEKLILSSLQSQIQSWNISGSQSVPGASIIHYQ